MGAHVARLVRAPAAAPAPPSFLILLIIFSCLVVPNLSLTDSEILLKFRDSLANTTALASWNLSVNPCSGDNGKWIGVRCSGGSVSGLKLENTGLKGSIDVDILQLLPHLRSISFMHNEFQGPLPRLRVLGALKSVFLSNNRFSGEIPGDAFVGMGSLKKVYLANNELTGSIPSSLITLTRLLELRIEGNQFQGRIPDFQQKGLKLVNVSNNELEGPIPHRLSKMDISSFSGNDGLCGQPLESCESRQRRAYVFRVAISVFVAGLLLGFVIGALIIYRRRRRTSSQLDLTSSFNDHHESKSAPTCRNQGTPAGVQPAATNRGASKVEQKLQLSFVGDDRERFDLQDLLRASAEVLGSGNFGSSYKAIIMNGQALVVKRYKQMNNVGREEFNEQMRRLGRLKHPNLLPLVAYYYRREEKLLVYDFVPNGSLASHLHGNQAGLDWKTRLHIIKGVARGLAYLYTEFPSLLIPHGHLKSSNVLLDDFYEPLLTDYALAPVTNPEHSRQLLVAYKSPECTLPQGHVNKKTDIWSLGTLILEMLTGRFPVSYIAHDKDADLATWVMSTVNDERTSAVFDKEMRGTKNCKGEMIKLLKIGLSCCERDEERRLSISEVVGKIEELRDCDAPTSDAPSYASRTIIDDDLNR
ncbi:pollen receptor-like kinase 4 [Punica granatum]|uniref:Uncharacterized protein n=2 Tax=Punica granatum TaxID=22663 RepID=A0A2I0L194_PUNGR|nr:pollen receptor-like kinase 4 [Punica granatum]PKI74481.1 hypothetical protein CRG98_005101 [Punica granatum]